MKLLWKIAIAVACLCFMCGAANLWPEDKVAIDPKLAEAARQCRIRAEQGDTEAQSKLGSMYYYARGVPQDSAKAVHWWRKAAEQGNVKGQYNLGFAYQEGKGVPQDYAEARRWYRKAADQGHAKGEDALGSMYYYGTGVPQDYAEASRWYRKAADHGDPTAESALGAMYYYGKGMQKDLLEAFGWYRKAADQGDVEGQEALGYMYEQGQGVSRNYADAPRWYRKAADQGYARGEDALGSAYYNGRGVTRDYAEAVRWYRKAAEQGYAKAQFNLGDMYGHGLGVPRDREEALRWFRKAAAQGDPQAQSALRFMEASLLKKLSYFLLLIPILGGLWWSIDRLLRRERFRDWPQKAAAQRKKLSWFFAIGSVVCLQFALSPILRIIHEHQGRLFFRNVLLPAVLMIPASIFGMAWWTVFKRKPSARGWGIAGSLIYILLALWPLVLLLARGGLGFIKFSWGGSAFVLAIGVTGLAAFSRPFAPSAEIPTALRFRNPGDGTNVFLDKLAILLIAATSFLAYVWWVRWLRATGIPSYPNGLRLFISLLVLLLAIALHELGHTLTGLAFGMKLRAFFVGPFQWRIREGKREFQFKPTRLLDGGGATGLVPATSVPNRWRDLCVIAAGPLVSIFTGSIALCVTLKLKVDSPLQARGTVALFAAWSLIGVLNLIPFRTGNTYSDGAQIWQILSNGPWADLHRVVAVIGSSLVTPLRPRDYDIRTIQRAAQGITEGAQALLLRLHAYSYFLDLGKLSEAGQALKEAGLVYDRSASDIPAALLTVFVFGNAYVLRDATAAREWWRRMEVKKPTRFNVDYWRAAGALHWIEGNLKEANDAWEKSNALAQQLPHAGAYEFDRDCCRMLHQAIDEAAAAKASSA